MKSMNCCFISMHNYFVLFILLVVLDNKFIVAFNNYHISHNSAISSMTTTLQQENSANIRIENKISFISSEIENSLWMKHLRNGALLVIDGDNVRGKTKFLISKEQLCQDLQILIQTYHLIEQVCDMMCTLILFLVMGLI